MRIGIVTNCYLKSFKEGNMNLERFIKRAGELGLDGGGHRAVGEIDKNALLLLNFKNEVLGEVACILASRVPEPHYRNWIYGDCGTLYWDIPTGEFRLYIDEPKRDSITIPQEPDDKHGWNAEIEHFIECIIEDREPYTSGRVEKETLRVIETAYQSIRERREVKLSH